MIVLGKVQFLKDSLYFRLTKNDDRFFWTRYWTPTPPEVAVQTDLTNYYLVYIYMNPFSLETSDKIILPYSNWYFTQKILQSRWLLPIAFCLCVLATTPLMFSRLNYSLTSLAYSLANPIINRMKRSYSYVRKFLVSKV